MGVERESGPVALHSNRGGSGTGSRGGRSRSTPPSAANRRRTASPRFAGGAALSMAWRGIFRTSSSVDRPGSAVLMRSLRFDPSSGSQFVLLALLPSVNAFEAPPRSHRRQAACVRYRPFSRLRRHAAHPCGLRNGDRSSAGPGASVRASAGRNQESRNSISIKAYSKSFPFATSCSTPRGRKYGAPERSSDRLVCPSGSCSSSTPSSSGTTT